MRKNTAGHWAWVAVFIAGGLVWYAAAYVALWIWR